MVFNGNVLITIQEIRRASQLDLVSDHLLAFSNRGAVEIIRECFTLVDAKKSSLDAQSLDYRNEICRFISQTPHLSRASQLDVLDTLMHETPGHTCDVPYCAEYRRIKQVNTEKVKAIENIFDRDIVECRLKLLDYIEANGLKGTLNPPRRAANRGR